jgi:hypothetical protein
VPYSGGITSYSAERNGNPWFSSTLLKSINTCEQFRNLVIFQFSNRNQPNKKPPQLQKQQAKCKVLSKLPFGTTQYGIIQEWFHLDLAKGVRTIKERLPI